MKIKIPYNFSKKRINETWTEYTLSNGRISVSFLNFGCIITKINVPDRFGKIENIVLSYKDYANYSDNPYYLGAIIGRVAGRVKYGELNIDKNSYTLDKNNGSHHLHGGNVGFHNVLWDVKEIELENGIGAELSYLSKDGESGYPGNVLVHIKYLLVDNIFHIIYEAETDKKTILTLTNHSYFNLSGNLKSTIENHKVTFNCSGILKLNEELIANKILTKIPNTFDFSNGKYLYKGFNDVDEQNKIAGNGYDHYFIFEKNKDNRVLLQENESGRNLIIDSDQDGMVMYTSNTMDDSSAFRSAQSSRYLGVCFEMQAAPSALWINELPSIYLSPGEKYKQKTTFTFTTE